MMRLLLDMDVVLDLFLHRHPWSADAAAIWKAQRQKKIDAHVAAFTIPTIYYLVAQETDALQALSVVDECLATVHIVAVTEETLQLARGFALNDFEDSLQAACAAQANLEFIVSRDPSGFTASPVPVISPAEFRARLRPGPGKKRKP